ncbi:hypothetical protein BC941DRAFT_445741 [Chlamydoabsidia padenii]|nr:hypothetical protein BC941DRAFT_445741 [Chlamydoabsidia padenii]
MMPADNQQQQPETRQKRAKIVSACSECRRKKTKCNGEQPCRNCQKSSVACVYPASHTDDKRNGPSKAALEAIEERLKAIEDMLKTIVQSQLDLDPVAVNKFLGEAPSSPPCSYPGLYISPSPTNTSIPPSNNNNNKKNNNNGGAPSTPPPSSYHRLSPPTSTSSTCSTSSGHELRLPSIHSLSAPSAEQRDLPPLGGLQDYYYQSNNNLTTTTTSSQQTSDTRYQHLDRKRKR